MKTDPTKTLTIRRRASIEIGKRFGKLKKRVKEEVSRSSLISNISYEFVRDSKKIELFDEWLQNEIDREILTDQGENFWLNAYIGEAYERGAKKVRLYVERNLLNLDKLTNYSPLSNRNHIERAELIYTRVFNDMKGVTDIMRGQMSRELANGMIRGEGSEKIAKAMTQRVDNVGIVRSRLIARTEIVESHNSASIKEAELLEEETGVDIKVQWLTNIDGRQRHSHEDRHEKIYTRQEAEELIGEPNCRCSVSAYIDIDNL